MSFSPLATIRRPEVLADPYPYYALLRSEAPVARDPLGAWVVSRYRDVHAVLNSSTASSDRLPTLLALRPDGADSEIKGLFAHYCE